MPSDTPSKLDISAIAAVVARTRLAQGLPPTISDPGIVGRLADLLALNGHPPEQHR